MLKKYKNELPTLLQKLDFSPSDFSFEENGTDFILTYRDSPMKFYIHQNPQNFHQFKYSYTLFNPRFEIKKPMIPFAHLLKTTAFLSNWCKGQLQQYIFEKDGPDELESLLNTSAEFVNIEDIDFESEEPFTLNEIETIKIGIEEVKTLLIEEQEVSSTEKEEIKVKMDYLTKVLERPSSRTDWKNILISTVSSIIIAVSFYGENPKIIWSLFAKIFSEIPILAKFLQSSLSN